MKKIILLMMVMVLIAESVFAANERRFYDEFADLNLWSNDAQGDWSASGGLLRAGTGYVSTCTAGGSNITFASNLDLDNCTSNSINVNWTQAEIGTMDTTDCLRYQYSTDGGTTWSALTLAFCDDSPKNANGVSLNALSPLFKFRFVCQLADASGEGMNIPTFNISCNTNDAHQNTNFSQTENVNISIEQYFGNFNHSRNTGYRVDAEKIYSYFDFKMLIAFTESIYINYTVNFDKNISSEVNSTNIYTKNHQKYYQPEFVCSNSSNSATGEITQRVLKDPYSIIYEVKYDLSNFAINSNITCSDPIYSEPIVPALSCNAPHVCTNLTFYNGTLTLNISSTLKDKTRMYFPFDISSNESSTASDNCTRQGLSFRVEDLMQKSRNATCTRGGVNITDIGLGYGKAVTFSGGGFINDTSVTVDITRADYCVCFWMRPTATTNGQRLFVIYDNSTNYITVTKDSTDDLAWGDVPNNASGTQNMTTTNTGAFWEIGSIQHVCLSARRLQHYREIFVNGTNYTSNLVPKSSTVGIGTNKGSFFGASNAMNNLYNGALDEFIAMNASCDNATVQRIFRNGTREVSGSYEFNVSSAVYNTFNTSILQTGNLTPLATFMSSKHSSSTCPSGLTSCSSDFGDYGTEISTDSINQNAPEGSQCGCYKVVWKNGYGNRTFYLKSFTVNTTNVATDSCTYSSGNWNVDCGDNCIISSSVDLNSNNLYITGGPGQFTIRARISEIGADSYNRGTGCEVRCENNACIED